MPHELVAELGEELGEELVRQGLERDIGAPGNRGVSVLGRFDAEPARSAAWSASGLYQAIKAFLAHSADKVAGEDADRLRKASTHWLRHSHASRALQGRGEQVPVPIQVVQNNLGHASIGTTSMYLSTERDERLRAMVLEVTPGLSRNFQQKMCVQQASTSGAGASSRTTATKK